MQQSEATWLRTGNSSDADSLYLKCITSWTVFADKSLNCQATWDRTWDRGRLHIINCG